MPKKKLSEKENYRNAQVNLNIARKEKHNMNNKKLQQSKKCLGQISITKQ